MDKGKKEKSSKKGAAVIEHVSHAGKLKARTNEKFKVGNDLVFWEIRLMLGSSDAYPQKESTTTETAVTVVVKYLLTPP